MTQQITAENGDQSWAGFNREPFGFRHELHRSPLFSIENLKSMMARWPATDYFVASGASHATQDFYGTGRVVLTPAQAMEQLEQQSLRILLKRLEKNDPAFRELLDSLYAEVCAAVPSLRNDKLIRLESFLFVSSNKTITPRHFDPEMNFFFQIAGEKIYNLHSPRAMRESDLERHYIRDDIDIGKVTQVSADPPRRFVLRPGDGLHQPSNSPHWVETDSIAISFSFAIETAHSRSVGRVRAFNCLERKLGIEPRPPGSSAIIDAAKSEAYRLARPALRIARKLRHG